MCIVFVAIESQPKYKYVILSNRDEDLSRPTLPSHFWSPTSFCFSKSPSSSSPSAPSTNSLLTTPTSSASEDATGIEILAGRDATRGGTWLGISKTGRFAVVTNFQERPTPTQDDSIVGRIRSPSLLPEFKSRGDLPTEFLGSSISPEEYLEEIRKDKEHYPGFNLIVGDCSGLYLYSNRDPTDSIVKLETQSTIGLTNSLLNGGWFKEYHGVSLVKNVEAPDPDLIAELASQSDFSRTGAPASTALVQSLQPLLDILSNTDKPPSGLAPDVYMRTGEKAAIFVDRLNLTPSSPEPHFYGTRCSIIILVDCENRVTFFERSLDSALLEWTTRAHHFQAQP